MKRYVEKVERVSYELSADEVKAILRQAVDGSIPEGDNQLPAITSSATVVTIRAGGSAILTTEYVQP